VQNGVNITNVKIDITYGPGNRLVKFNVEWFENGVRKTAEHNN
jgi:hypothetical protein